MTTAYAIKSHKGNIWIDTILPSKQEVIKKFVGRPQRDLPWKWWYSQGWRCVKVSITEIKP